MSKSRIVLTISLVFLLVLPLLHAEGLRTRDTTGKIKELPKNNVLNITSRRVKTNDQLKVIRRLMLEKNYLAASALLESIYEDDPTHPSVISQLLRCYENLAYYQKGEELVRRQIKKRPDHYYYYITLGKFLAKQEKTDEAMVQFNQAVSLIKDNDKNKFISVINNLKLLNLHEQAIELIDSLRIANSEKKLFALQKGDIYKNQREYAKAASEYCLRMTDTTQSTAEAPKRIKSLFEFPESSSITEKVMTDYIRETQSKAITGMLTSLYLLSARFDDAFKFSIRLDSLDNNNGKGLVSFLNQCYDKELYPQTIKMSRYILRHNKSSTVLNDTYFKYADALSKSGFTKEAIAVYDTLFEKIDVIQSRSETLFQIGEIYANNFNDYHTSLIYYDSVINYYQGGIGLLKSKLAKPLSLLKLRKFDQAKTEYEALLSRHIIKDDKEKIVFHLALIDFYQQNIDSCKAALNKLIVDFPRGFYVNDALELILVIDEASANREIINHYSEAYFYSSKNSYDSARISYLSIVDNNSRLLGDMALYKLIRQTIKNADSFETLNLIERMLEEFAESYYLPYCLKIKADYYFVDETKKEEAKEIYKLLLEKFPNYPFISKVREILVAEEKEIIG